MVLVKSTKKDGVIASYVSTEAIKKSGKSVKFLEFVKTYKVEYMMKIGRKQKLEI
jgi:hypothetical protein